MSGDISEDAKESLEVASQCLQTAYGVSSEDKHLEVSKSLSVIFSELTKSEPVRKLSCLNISKFQSLFKPQKGIISNIDICMP
jgi:hypothetical protein